MAGFARGVPKGRNNVAKGWEQRKSCKNENLNFTKINVIKALVVRDRIIVFLNMYHLCEPPFPSPTAHRMSRNWKLYGTIRIYRTIGHRSTCLIFTASNTLNANPQSCQQTNTIGWQGREIRLLEKFYLNNVFENPVCIMCVYMWMYTCIYD